jgi:hypothetical protein
MKRTFSDKAIKEALNAPPRVFVTGDLIEPKWDEFTTYRTCTLQPRAMFAGMVSWKKKVVATVLGTIPFKDAGDQASTMLVVLVEDGTITFSWPSHWVVVTD